MRDIEAATDYWFTVEPYVYVSIVNQHALLYNTLGGTVIESDQAEVIELLQETLHRENGGVVLLTYERYTQKEINGFINDVREKYMGDIIDVSLSKGKPVQLLPYFNFFDKDEIYSKPNVILNRNVLDKLSEISFHVDHTVDVTKLISFLQLLPGQPTFNITGEIWEVENYVELLAFFDRHPSPKNIVCSYTRIKSMQPAFENNFLYRLSVHFPLDMNQWNHSRRLLLDQPLPVEYIFDVLSLEDCQQVEQLIEQFKIEKYRINPVYNGDNLPFFEETVFLTKEDILSASLSIKDIFSRQLINIYDFGKVHIMPNGDTYANLNHPAVGNIFTDSIYEIVYKEIKEGGSWLRIREQTPCNDCIYQWLCPSPSNYEITLDRPNLCHVKR